jgi:hypothetical protein
LTPAIDQAQGCSGLPTANQMARPIAVNTAMYGIAARIRYDSTRSLAQDVSNERRGSSLLLRSEDKTKDIEVIVLGQTRQSPAPGNPRTPANCSVEASDKATTAATNPCVRPTTDEQVDRAGDPFPEDSVISGDKFVQRSAQPFRFVNRGSRSTASPWQIIGGGNARSPTRFGRPAVSPTATDDNQATD